MTEVLGDNQVFVPYDETWEAPVRLRVTDVDWGDEGITLTVEPDANGIDTVHAASDPGVTGLWLECLGER